MVIYLSRAKDNLSSVGEVKITLINIGRTTMNTRLATLVKFDRTKFKTYASAKLNNAVRTPSSQRQTWTLSTESNSELNELISMFRDLMSEKSYFGLVIDDQFIPLDNQAKLNNITANPHFSMVA